MKEKEYHRLMAEEKRINDEMRALIVSILEENHREIAFVPASEEDWEGDYPVTATFWSNKDNPNIDITDVYLDKNNRILVDGYNSREGIRETRLEVETGQYQDVLYFIGFVLGWENRKQTDVNPCEVTVLFGSGVIQQYSETGELPSEEWLLENGGVIDTVTFDSQKELDAYLKGLNDADGWIETLVLDDFMKKFLKEKRESEY